MTMGPCEHYQERWLDHVYGLLEEAESRELADHLSICPSCQANLAEAEKEQGRLARAARRIRHVPEFQVPADELAPVMASGQQVHDNGPATLAFRPAPRRSLRRRLLPVWAAAAALLAMIVGGMQIYQRGGEDREQAVARARADLEAIKGQFATLKTQADAERQNVIEKAKADMLRVSLVGSTQTNPAAPYTCRVATRDLEGRPVAADLDVQFVSVASGEVLHKQHLASSGVVDVLIPAGLKLDKDVRLEVAAKHGSALAKAREIVHVAAGSHLVHVALNKSVAQLGEVIFFRALAVERFSLKPVNEPLPLRFSLVNAKGKALLEVTATTGPGGIASGELALAKLPPGEYQLQVAAADPKRHIQARAATLEIFEQLADFEIRQDQKAYHPGEKIVLDVNMRDDKGAPAKKNEIVKVQVDTAKKAGTALAMGAIGRTDEQGRAKVQFTVPDNFDGTRLNVYIQNGNGKVKTVRSIAVIPSRLEIDFYPEGGDLVAGVPQRVFFRVRTPRGETAVPDGSFTLHSSKGVVFQSEKEQSLGSFLFTPDSRETYTVRMGALEIKNPFEKLGIKPDGVVMSVSNSVAGENEAIDVQIQKEDPRLIAGDTGQWLVVATCRGQIVGQQFMDRGGLVQTQVKLSSGIHGMIRVTAYDIQDQKLIPMAERLVYRIPVRRLSVNATASNFEPGKQAQLKIEAKNENGQPASAWALALVVDEQYRQRREQGLAPMLLGGDVDDLADAPLLADDTPETRAAVELFLGTHGWRRFVKPTAEEPAQFAQANTGLFSVEAPNAEQTKAQFSGKVASGLAALQSRVERERAQLSERQETAAAALTAAFQARHAYERLPTEWLRLALGIVAAAALGTGAGCLVLGLYRLSRRRRPTRAFAGAFSAIGLCLALYLGAGSVTPFETVAQGDGDRWNVPRIELAAVDQAVAATPFSGQVALAGPGTGLPKNAAAVRSDLDLSQALVLSDGSAALVPSAKARFIEHPQMQERFQEAQKRQLGTGTDSYGREFAYRNMADFAAQPTLFWHPALRLEKGQAAVAFDVPAAAAAYRIVILGHDSEGRLGFQENHVTLKPSGK